jgi:glycosyltransferase involved in cell wall biosynthesis
MVCGRPSVLTDIGVNTDLIKDGINGYIIPALNIKQCDLTIEKASQGIGLEARNQVLTKINFNSHKDIYDNAVR